MVLELIALLCAGLFAGAAVYVTLVEHPARLECGPAVALAEFRPSYRRAAAMQASLAAVGLLTAVGAWALGRGVPVLVAGPLARRADPLHAARGAADQQAPARPRARPSLHRSRVAAGPLGTTPRGAQRGQRRRVRAPGARSRPGLCDEPARHAPGRPGAAATEVVRRVLDGSEPLGLGEEDLPDLGVVDVHGEALEEIARARGLSRPPCARGCAPPARSGPSASARPARGPRVGCSGSVPSPADACDGG